MSVSSAAERHLAALPTVRTSLLGRVHEADQLHRLVTDPGVRLLTLVGPGGVGKTRLALHVATEALDAFAGDVVFVPLASIREPRLVLLAIGGAFGFTADPDDGYEAALVDHLRERRALMVLDNLEQVLDAAPAIDRLLAGAPGLVVLVTSQVPLALPDERVYALAPLLTLDPDGVPVERVKRLDAVTLFEERARAADPAFRLDDDPALAVDVARICHRLDGLPLAIELAAARANVMSPRTLLERLENRMSALGEYRGDVPDRLRTMRAAVGWSYDLLEPDEQALFRRLAVFPGGWQVEAVVAVGPGGPDPCQMLETLVQRSLVYVAGEVGGESRYAMLQTLRDYGLEQLVRQGEEADVREAHALYITQVAEAAEPHLTGSEQEAMFLRLDAEMDNIRAAIAWAFESARTDLVLRIGGALWRYLSIRALVTDARGWLDRALLVRSPELMPYRGKALIGAGYLAEERRDLAVAQAYFDQGLHLARAMGDAKAEGQALIGLGTVAHDRGEYDIALGHHGRAVTLARESGDRRALAIGYANLGAVTYFQGRLEDSLRYFSEGADILLEMGDIHAAAVGVSNMAALANELGDYEQGVRHIRRALELQRQINSRRDLPSSLVNLGEAERELGHFAESREAFAEAIAIARENDDLTMYALALHGLAVLEYMEGQVPESAALLQESTELLAEMDDPHSMIENAHLTALLCLASERYEDAATIIAANERLGTELGIGTLSRRQEKIAEMTASARAGLGEERFAAATEAAQGLDIDTLTRRIQATCRAIVGPRHRSPVITPVAPEPTPVAHHLTAREMDILRLLALGKSTAEIAEELFVSARTVSTHVTHILEKLGVPNRTAAVAYAMREGLVQREVDA